MTEARDLTVMLVAGGNRWRFADPAGTPLEGCRAILPVDFAETVPEREREAAFDAALPEADLIVVSPWLRDMPVFTPERWARAGRLKAIAGTFDNRFAHWIDVADALRRGVTLIDTSRSMTPTVAEFALPRSSSCARGAGPRRAPGTRMASSTATSPAAASASPATAASTAATPS